MLGKIHSALERGVTIWKKVFRKPGPNLLLNFQRDVVNANYDAGTQPPTQKRDQKGLE